MPAGITGGDSNANSEAIAQLIFLIRGQKVMLDSDLARLYGVQVYRLNEAVKRNSGRFPGDFMFQLTSDEATALRSQIAILKLGRGQHRKFLPYAFTEHGVAMLSSVLRSPKAIEVNIAIIRAFIRIRELIATHRELAQRMEDLEQKVGLHDHEIQTIFSAIKQLVVAPKSGGRRIGF